jgi:hypothetical protein
VAFTRVTNGNITDADDLNQIIRAWEGDADGGSHPLLLTQVNDAVNYATDVRQLDSTVGLLFRYRNSNDEEVIKGTKDGTILGKPLTAASGVTIDDLLLKTHNHTGAPGMGALLTKDSMQNRTRRFSVPYVGGQTPADGAALIRQYRYGYVLPPTVASQVFTNFYIPLEFVSTCVLEFVVATSGMTGNLHYEYGIDVAKIGEAVDTHTYSETDQIIEVTPALTWTTLFGVALTDLTREDYVSVYFGRRGDKETDTIEGGVFAPGILVDFTADM